MGDVKIVEGRIEVPEFLFDLDRFTFTPGITYTRLADFAELLSKRPDIQHVLIEGHTDNKASARYNLYLSQRRARAVMQWLIAAGVHPGRLSVEGRGLSCPVASNDTEEGRAKNRRVQVYIVKMGDALVPREPVQCAPLTTKPAPAKKPVRRGRRGR